MVRKNLPSGSGLPDAWDTEMERRLGYLEAQDEAGEARIMVKVLKREFPKLSRNVISAETLVRWIDWLDRQDGVRSVSYRAGLAAGQSKVLEILKAKGVELEPMNLNKYCTSDDIASPGSQVNEGVRLVESDGGVDDEVRAAAGGLESIINGSDPSSSANMTPSVSQHSMYRTRDGNASGSPMTSTSFVPVTYQSHGSSSGVRRDQDAQIVRDLGAASSHSPSISPKASQPRSATTSVSTYFPGSATSTSFPSTPNTPAQKHRSKSMAHSQSPRGNKNVKDNPGATVKRSATVGSSSETPTRARNGLGISNPSTTQGLRERRQLGELNVGIIPPSRSIQALPDIRGKENHDSPGNPSGNSTTGTGLRARVKAKWNRT